MAPYIPDDLQARLLAGQKVPVQFSAHPGELGFERLGVAEQHGQSEDWALSLDDGSRLHAWLMPSGQWVLHRDAIDPGRGPIAAIRHVATETAVGPALLMFVAIAGGLYLIKKSTT